MFCELSYFNIFFDSELRPCSRQSITNLLDKASKEEGTGKYYMDLLCELYHLFLYHLHV